jgi:hypothetical protein
VRVSLRQLVATASTIAVAIVLALGVPVAQLRTAATRSECCCPDPAHCKCPDHQGDESPQPTMRACHRAEQQFVSPVLPAFLAPAPELAFIARPAAVSSVFVLPAPHPAPAPRRPDAPS